MAVMLTAFQRIATNENTADYGHIMGAVRDKLDSTQPTKYVRRPMRGITAKPDTYASLSLSSTGGMLHNSSLPPRRQYVSGSEVISKADAMAEDGNYTTNFLLQSITETRNEKAQYVQTFGATYAFFYGEQPRIINCAAILVSSANFTWEQEWWENYSQFLRGTSLSALNQTAILEFENCLISGYIINATTIKQAADPNLVQLNFSMFVESVAYTDLASEGEAYRTKSTNIDLLGVGSSNPEDHSARKKEDGTSTGFFSTTEAVRRANIEFMGNQTNVYGGLGKIAGAIADAGAAVSNFQRRARNLLYGRNMVVPQSFSSPRAHESVFPEGTGAEGLDGAKAGNLIGRIFFSSGPPKQGFLKAHTVNLRLSADGDQYRTATAYTAKYNYENYDEYVTAPASLGNTAGARKILEEYERENKRDPVDNSAARQAFASMGILIPKIENYNGLRGLSASMAIQEEKRRRGDQAAAGILRGLARVAYGAAVLARGESIVNARADLQAAITNPNATGEGLAAMQSSLLGSQAGFVARYGTGSEQSAVLSAAVLEAGIAEAQETKRSADQRRLIAEAEASELRGEKGTIYDVDEAILTTLL